MSRPHVVSFLVGNASPTTPMTEWRLRSLRLPAPLNAEQREHGFAEPMRFFEMWQAGHRARISTTLIAVPINQVAVP